MKPAIELGGVQPDNLALTTEWVQLAEKLGVAMAFSAEAWWSDAVTPLAYLADKTERIKLATGIMQVTARTPAMAAMTAMYAVQHGKRYCTRLTVRSTVNRPCWEGQN